ncbi:MAG TPA: hypothetical protein VGC41_08030, partial [Kofleriaceae bacterium]
MSEHDPLAKIDLSVVGAPPAPERFARGVLTRFDAMEAAIAAARHRRRRRLAWLASSVAAVAAIVVALVALWPSPPVSGSYSTQTPHHLAVAGVAADLGSGASVAWSVEGDRVTVEQRGDVTWNVPIGKRLRVMVAGVGSVEAQDTTLRVEARMNLIDRKSVAVATAVAATAIVVTVIHGRANVTSGGTEMTVKQGSSAVATAGKPPAELLTSASPVAAMIVYSGDEVWARTELADLENALDRLVLPPGSRVGAISYSTGSVLEVPLGPASDFTGKRLGDAEKYRDR